MKLIIKPRHSGKTYLAIQEAAKSFAYIACIDRNEVLRVAKAAETMGVDIPFPLTFSELKDYVKGRRKIKVIIDNADILLSMLFDVDIQAITLTDDQEASK